MSKVGLCFFKQWSLYRLVSLLGVTHILTGCHLQNLIALHLRGRSNGRHWLGLRLRILPMWLYPSLRPNIIIIVMIPLILELHQ
jgi:hypothetical protein